MCARGKQYLSEKSLVWLLTAPRLFPHARYFAKTDTDSFVVWRGNPNPNPNPNQVS